MTLPASGAISMSQVNTELGFYAASLISLNDTAVRNMFGKPSGTISMSDGYGKSAIPNITWTLQTGLSSTTWGTTAVSAIAWNGSVFCALGASGKCATSPDGITWTYRTGLSSTTWGTSGASGIGIAWNGSVFCAVTGSSAACATSPDGITWTYRTGLSSVWPIQNISNLYWTGSQFIVHGTNATIATSPDGITWTYRNSLGTTGWGTGNSILGLASNGSTLCAVGTNARLATSTDNGVTWTYQSGVNFSSSLWGTTTSIVRVVWTGSHFFITSPTGNTALSSNGISWSYSTALSGLGLSSAGAVIVDAIWNGTVICVLYNTARAASSKDGLLWKNQSATISGTNNRITWGNSKFCVAGASGRIWTGVS